MKYLFQYLAFSVVGLFLFACGSYPVKNSEKSKEKPVIISNDSLEYEVIIIDVGFTLYLNTIAKPKNYYSLSYLENRNNIYVTNWNIRALNPSKFNSSIYENRIDYSPQIRYGLEVNYKLFNYFQFAQQKYKIRLDRGSGLSPNFR
ncbi:DUF6146 family protein [Flavobacteriaceae bacterium]|nr:DUF6146 family protein [Flavobacteriaceae bacterium]MDB2632974.1 DUF6146 family protein [Flavobacteriaceae bacterium]MDC0331638.1 DUF6146 family protein [Flavobacteriaceae bacterium]